MSVSGQTVAGVMVPDTKLAREATEVHSADEARRFLPGNGVLWTAIALHTTPGILQTFTDGIAPRPGTTFGNENADVLERFVPGFQRRNFVDVILNSEWPE